MSFFHKKNVTKCLGHHYAIWTSDSNFLLAPNFFYIYKYKNNRSSKNKCLEFSPKYKYKYYNISIMTGFK